MSLKLVHIICIECVIFVRYFTWDAHKFPNPLEMTANLTARGRKLVTIVDPHIKRDSNYFFYKENHDRDLYVHTKDGSEFDGELVLVPKHIV